MSESPTMMVKSNITLHISSEYDNEAILDDIIESLRVLLVSYTTVSLKGITLARG
jgi:hypothetical protein